MYREIHLDAPNVGETEKKYLNKAIDSGYVSTAGPFVPDFENTCTRYLNTGGTVSTNSGTSALHMALYELGIGKGDEVIVPALTFVATVNPVVYVGATPVFVDVDIRTWNLAAELIEEAVTEKTKAIIPVHLYGNPCDMDEINRIAGKYGLYVIEDASESLGATYRGRLTGTLGDFGCFSFNGNKTITTGGGGLVAGNDIKSLEHIKFLVNQARDNTEESYHSEIGFNYRMTNLQAALGLAQFENLEKYLIKKKTFNDIYKEELKDLKAIYFQDELETAESSYWFTCMTAVNETSRVELQNTLKLKGVPTRRIFVPVNEMPPYRQCRFLGTGNSHYIYERGVCLPGSTRNDAEDIRYVCKSLKEFYFERSYVC